MAGGESACDAGSGCGSAAVRAGGSALGGTEEGVGVASGTAAGCSVKEARTLGIAAEVGAGSSCGPVGDWPGASEPTLISFAGCLSSKNPEPKKAPVIPTPTSAMSAR